MISLMIIDKQKGIPVYGWICSKKKADILEQSWKRRLNFNWYSIWRYDK